MFQYRRKVKCMLDTVIVTPYHYDSMPTITLQSASGWTRIANRSPVRITTTQRPMRKENVCECEPDYGCNR